MRADNGRIATLGDINIDVILEVDDLPRRGGEVFSSSRRELLGGSAANTAVVLARLGLTSAIMGAVGDDEAGRRAIHRLGSIGVDTDLVSVSPTHPTAMNTILVTPDGERTMVGARGANVAYEETDGWQQGVDWLHISGYALMEGPQQRSARQMLSAAAGSGMPISLDVPVGVGAAIRDQVSDGLADLRVVTGSRAALVELTGGDEPTGHLSDVPQLAITSGDAPLLLVREGEEIILTPPSVDAVDVTGAGDAFVAGLIAAELSGLGPGPAAVLAAAAGAAATLVSGASETLEDPATWRHLLDDDRWSDADRSWLAEVRSWVGGISL